MTPEEILSLKEILLSKVPKKGDKIGNVTLRDKFISATKNDYPSINEDDYWIIRNELIDDNKLARGKGKGGSVYLIIETEEVKTTELIIEDFSKEIELYEPLKKTLFEYWTKENNIRNYILEITASQGRRTTGGRWTRPDLTLIAVNAYSYLPGKFLEITTFEVKPNDLFDITGVFEAAAHRAFAHYAYLAIHTTQKNPEDEDFDRLKSECRRLGVGLITFLNPNKYETLEVIVEPDRADPAPANINDFIHRQIDNKTKILEMIK